MRLIPFLVRNCTICIVLPQIQRRPQMRRTRVTQYLRSSLNLRGRTVRFQTGSALRTKLWIAALVAGMALSAPAQTEVLDAASHLELQGQFKQAAKILHSALEAQSSPAEHK